MNERSHTSAQGFELTFAVNVLAQHLLFKKLAPVSRSAVNVVLVGSGTHYGNWHSYGMVPPPQWENPVDLARPDMADSRAGPRAYATSKLGVLLLAHAWQRKLGTRARINVFDPGLMPGTGLARELSGAQLWAWNHVLPRLTRLPGWSTPQRSGEHLAAFALGERHSELRGGYVELARVRQSSAASYDVVREDELVRACEEMVG